MAVEVNAQQAGGPDGKYGLLSKDLIHMLKTYEIKYFREDKPVPFCGMEIHPIKVRDFEEFSHCTTCLTLNKNETPAGIRLSHLEFLITKIQSADVEESRLWSYRLQRLFEMCFQIKNGLRCKNCGRLITYDSKEFLDFSTKLNEMIAKEAGKLENLPLLICPDCGGTGFNEMIKITQDPNTKKAQLVVDGHTITKDDYNKLRQIILYQNFYDYVDESWVDPEIKKDHDEKLRLEQAKNDVHATIEKKVICLSIATNYKFDEIYEMPIRKFTMALATVDDLINYKIKKQAVMSGFVSLPKGEKIEHWIYKPNKDMYGDSYKSTDDVHSSVSVL